MPCNVSRYFFLLARGYRGLDLFCRLVGYAILVGVGAAEGKEIAIATAIAMEMDWGGDGALCFASYFALTSLQSMIRCRC